MVVSMVKKTETLQDHEFEREHFPCAKEWWCVEGFFTTIKNNKKWSFKADFSQGCRSLSIFDLDNNKYYYFYSENNFSKIETKKNKLYAKCDKSYIKGSHPAYEMHFLDANNNINLNLKFHAESLPYWVAQQITNGWLPWGLGYYRYGFIPKNDIKGTINFNNKRFTVNGKGYIEHIWGDFSYLRLSSSRRSIKKTISVYAKLIGWWVHNQNIKIPKSITFSTDNRPPGYDWFWAILDNGWSLFFGNTMFWITEGPVTGTLILSKDGKKYDEFSNIRFKYNKMKYLDKYDFYYPVELEIIATKDHEKLFLHISNTTQSIENIFELANRKNVLGFLISHVPSEVNGYYSKDDEKIVLKGSSKLESHRLLKVFGHNSLKFNFTLSQNRFAILSGFDSHYFGKKMDINLQFLPRPKLKINYNRINKPQLK